MGAHVTVRALSLKVQVGLFFPVADADTNSKPAGKGSPIPSLENAHSVAQNALMVKVSVFPTVTGSGVDVFSIQKKTSLQATSARDELAYPSSPTTIAAVSVALSTSTLLAYLEPMNGTPSPASLRPATVTSIMRRLINTTSSHKGETRQPRR